MSCCRRSSRCLRSSSTRCRLSSSRCHLVCRCSLSYTVQMGTPSLSSWVQSVRFFSDSPWGMPSAMEFLMISVPSLRETLPTSAPMTCSLSCSHAAQWPGTRGSSHCTSRLLVTVLVAVMPIRHHQLAATGCSSPLPPALGSSQVK